MQVSLVRRRGDGTSLIHTSLRWKLNHHIEERPGQNIFWVRAGSKRAKTSAPAERDQIECRSCRGAGREFLDCVRCKSQARTVPLPDDASCLAPLYCVGIAVRCCATCCTWACSYALVHASETKECHTALEVNIELTRTTSTKQANATVAQHLSLIHTFHLETCEYLHTPTEHIYHGLCTMNADLHTTSYTAEI